MAYMNIDINETEIFNLYPAVLDTLLKDYWHSYEIFLYSHSLKKGHLNNSQQN